MPDPTTGPDAFLLDSEQMGALTDQHTLATGLAMFRENRVTDLDCDGQTLSAQIDDPDSDQTLSLSLDLDDDRQPVWQCPCQQDRCAHGIALLLAYHARQTETGNPLDAVEAAIRERMQRGRTEVQVTPSATDQLFGTWKAQTINSGNRFARSYRVHIRSLHRRANFCTCPDFATNQLGTCKHIEAVLHHLGKRPDFADLQQQPVSIAYVFLDWEQDDPPVICLHRVAHADPQLADLLDYYFDDAGRFRRRLPGDFFRFADLVADRADIDVGEDAQSHARRLAAVAEQRLRAAEIRERLIGSGGRLPGIRARLYPYQVEGAAFLAASGRALLADDMGLGKTLQAITAAAWLTRHAQVARTLIVCPSSLKHQWQRELERFTGIQARVVEGPVAERGAAYGLGTPFFIVNYELVLRDLSLITERLQPDLLILDEAQRIKNWRTQIATAIKRIPSRYAFVLSGTPLENRLEDLYSLMQVVDPHVLGPLWRYLLDFHITDDKGKVLGYRNLSELRRRLTPVMLRRDRSLVAEQLPQRIDSQRDVALTTAQQELHDSAMRSASKLGATARRRPLTPSEQNRLMAALQQARMACNAAGLVDKISEGSPKLDELESLLDELRGQADLKAVVFSQWERMTQMVEQRIRSMGLGSVRLHGGIPSARRGDLIDRFRDDASIQVFISTDAGATGLNLQNASLLINMDVPWNPAVLNQRIARIHRLGQRRPVHSISLVASDGYEGQVLSLARGKGDLFENVMEPEATGEVLGISRRLVDSLVETLTEQAAGEAQDNTPTESVATDAASPADRAKQGAQTAIGRDRQNDRETADQRELQDSIEGLQTHFGDRVQRILSSGGSLLVVLTNPREEDDRFVRQLATQIPIALLDPIGLRGLQRLGSASPLAAAETLFANDREAANEPDRLWLVAREKWQGARQLMDQHSPHAAMELLLSSLLSVLALRAGRNQPFTPAQAGLWIHREALPDRTLETTQALLALQAIALAQADHVPEEVFSELWRELGGLLDQPPS